MKGWRDEFKNKPLYDAVSLTIKLDEYENIIREKNELIEKMKCCGNCKHQGQAEWCNLIEDWIEINTFGSNKCKWEL